ncbi:protein PAXX [Clupea harengus]|uniref:Protein PAXX n=1 Tax=Clupea harengus TaxID=7950 RepID=A0A6P3VJ69_CLUHA|nr:protein PAXX [Clupea harengus]
MDPSTIRKQFFFTVSDKTDGSKYLCYTHDCAAALNIGVTDAVDVWRARITDENKAQLLKHYSLKSTEDCITKLRSSCGRGNAFVSVELDQVVLHLGPSPTDMTMNMTKLTDVDGKVELKELLFRMTDCLSHWQGTEGGQVLYSPGKNSHKRTNDFEPRRLQSGNGSSTGVRKRLPGDSLINPGTRSKRPATGVAFDDDTDDL